MRKIAGARCRLSPPPAQSALSRAAGGQKEEQRCPRPAKTLHPPAQRVRAGGAAAAGGETIREAAGGAVVGRSGPERSQESGFSPFSAACKREAARAGGRRKTSRPARGSSNSEQICMAYRGAAVNCCWHGRGAGTLGSCMRGGKWCDTAVLKLVDCKESN